MYERIDPPYDYDYWRGELIREKLVSEVYEALTPLISEKDSVQDLIDCFHYAWQQEDKSAERLAKRLSLGQEHLYALDGDTTNMLDEIRNHRF